MLQEIECDLILPIPHLLHLVVQSLSFIKVMLLFEESEYAGLEVSDKRQELEDDHHCIGLDLIEGFPLCHHMVCHLRRCRRKPLGLV